MAREGGLLHVKATTGTWSTCLYPLPGKSDKCRCLLSRGSTSGSRLWGPVWQVSNLLHPAMCLAPGSDPGQANGLSKLG